MTMPTTFFGLFLFSLALSLIATFTTLGVLKLVRRVRARQVKAPRSR